MFCTWSSTTSLNMLVTSTFNGKVKVVPPGAENTKKLSALLVPANQAPLLWTLKFLTGHLKWFPRPVHEERKMIY